MTDDEDEAEDETEDEDEDEEVSMSLPEEGNLAGIVSFLTQGSMFK